MPEERLQKILSRAGIASRRQAEAIIREGRVTVNGTPVTGMGSKADLGHDHIKVDGRLLRAPRTPVYIVLHKPNNCVTTVTDPQQRATVMELLRGVKERVYPVGRLDYHSEGLLLITNDGEFANAIQTGGERFPKTYLVKVTGKLDEKGLERFRTGMILDKRRTKPAEIRLSRAGDNPWYEVTLTEGRQNQLRRMFHQLGLLVEKLKRVKIGFLELGSLQPGEYRTLTEREVARIRKKAAKS
jgi:23S rRNA pseudouridine2605 synthase